MCRSAVHTALVFAVLALVSSTTARAGDLSTNADIFEELPTAYWTQVDISARATAVGGAATAVPWGDLDHWANPALLGDANGIRYVHGATPLPLDVTFTSDIVQVGARGLGAVFSGQPFDAGGATLDFGKLTFSDGIETTTFHPRDEINGWGAGIRVLEALGNAVPEAARWSRMADVSIGYMHKRDQLDLDIEPPASLASTHDWGVLVQATPVDGFRDGKDAVAVGVAVGYSDINAGGHEDGASTLVYRQRRTGVAARFAAGHGPVLRPLGQGLTPLVTLIGSFDHADHGAGDDFYGHSNVGGAELTVMNIVSLRAGRDAGKWTSGWGLALPFGALGGASYDEARWPLALTTLHRRQFAVWLDPVEVWHAAAGKDARARAE